MAGALFASSAVVFCAVAKTPGGLPTATLVLREMKELTSRTAQAVARAAIATRDGRHARNHSTFAGPDRGACRDAGAESTVHACVCADTPRRSAATAWQVPQVARCAAMDSRVAGVPSPSRYSMIASGVGE